MGFAEGDAAYAQDGKLVRITSIEGGKATVATSLCCDPKSFTVDLSTLTPLASCGTGCMPYKGGSGTFNNGFDGGVFMMHCRMIRRGAPVTVTRVQVKGTDKIGPLIDHKLSPFFQAQMSHVGSFDKFDPSLSLMEVGVNKWTRAVDLVISSQAR